MPFADLGPEVKGLKPGRHRQGRCGKETKEHQTKKDGPPPLATAPDPFSPWFRSHALSAFGMILEKRGIFQNNIKWISPYLIHFPNRFHRTHWEKFLGPSEMAS